MPVEIDTIIGQLEWASQRGLSELTVTLGDTRLNIRRSGSKPGKGPQSPPVGTAASDNDAAPQHSVDAPMAGICHLASDPGSAPFVQIGDDISLGQTICVIEAMKVMTSVTSTLSGTVSAILVEDGASVAAGTALFEVHP